MFRNHKWRQVLILAVAQALRQTVSVMVITVSALAAISLTASSGDAMLPISWMFLGAAVAIAPASLWMSRVGRREGSVASAAVSILAGSIAAIGSVHSSPYLMCAATFLIEVYMVFAQSYRFAAIEISEECFRSRAISLILAGGVVAALVGAPLGGGRLSEVMGWQRMSLLSVPRLVAAVAAAGLVWLTVWRRRKVLTVNAGLENSELPSRSACAEKRTVAACRSINLGRVEV